MDGAPEVEQHRPPATVSPARVYTGTSRWARTAAMGGWGAALVLWSLTLGVPNDTIGIFLWLWLATVAWHVQAPPRHHLGFLRDWWAPMVGLVIYFLSRGLADEFGRTAAFQMPIDVDRWLGFGHLPTEVLQQALCEMPCRATDPRWYDLLLTTVYSTHFGLGLTLAAVLWMVNRAEWKRWMRRYLAINFAGLAIYILYPMAPPWMAAQHGLINPQIERLTGRGWADIGLERVNMILDGVGNPVAAMPSLHTGISVLVALYGISRLRSAWRWLLLLYPALMCVALVYYAEHYVIDLVAGAALAIAVMWGCAVWERSRDVAPDRTGQVSSN